MKNIYLISQNNFLVENNAQLIELLPNKIIKLNNVTKSDYLYLFDNNKLTSPIKLNFNTGYYDGNINFYKNDNEELIEIISLTKNSLLQKFFNDKFELLIYSNHVELCYKTKFYYYYFKADDNNYFIEKNEYIYIFNSKNILTFNTEYFSFNLLKCFEFKIQNNVIEMFCNIPKNNNFYILYKFDLENKDISLKKFSKGNINIDNYNLPFLFFYLLKNNFDISAQYLSSTISFADVKKYLLRFNSIFEFNNKYFLSSNKNICEIKFSINENVIVDLD